MKGKVTVLRGLGLNLTVFINGFFSIKLGIIMRRTFSIKMLSFSLNKKGYGVLN